MKVKFFQLKNPMEHRGWFMKVEYVNTEGIEEEINKWLADNPGITISHICQSTGGGSYAVAKNLISVWYEEG